jgi:two-component system, OmpR family, sensor histidine kinase KdpD
MNEAALPLHDRASPFKRWGAVIALVALATAAARLLDNEVSQTSQAMLYLAAVVVASYTLDRLAAIACAVASVTAFNFFFVPPRYTLAVEHHEHLIALVTMLGVSLAVSQLAAALREESRAARLSERRARQLQRLAKELTEADTEVQVRELGLLELQRAFAGPVSIALADPLRESTERTPRLDGLRCCVKEAALLGPGTPRWPGLDAWYVPLGDKGHVFGAASVEPAVAADVPAREHAQALCSLLAQALWRIQLAAQMQEAQDEVQRHETQRTLLAAVSHDLRTPLAAIVGAVSSLQSQRDRLADAEKTRLLASIENEAGYLSTVTENTLQLVRLSGHALQLQCGWESMEEIVGAVLARVRQRDPTRRIKSRVPRELPLVKVDPVLIAQLLANLLDNALKYSDDVVDLSVQLDGGRVTTTVKDRGPGIAAADMERLFEPFVRGRHERESGHRGAGLGLAVCRAIAQAHGGTLAVRRRSGGGSSFCLALPVEAEQPAGAKA